MNNKKLKELISDLIMSENNYHDFALECVKHIFGENNQGAIYDFNSTIDHFDEGFCLSLHSMFINDNRRKGEREEVKEVSNG
jgi:hypothetical protein